MSTPSPSSSSSPSSTTQKIPPPLLPPSSTSSTSSDRLNFTQGGDCIINWETEEDKEYNNVSNNYYDEKHGLYIPKVSKAATDFEDDPNDPNDPNDPMKVTTNFEIASNNNATHNNASNSTPSCHFKNHDQNINRTSHVHIARDTNDTATSRNTSTSTSTSSSTTRSPLTFVIQPLTQEIFDQEKQTTTVRNTTNTITNATKSIHESKTSTRNKQKIVETEIDQIFAHQHHQHSTSTNTSMSTTTTVTTNANISNLLPHTNTNINTSRLTAAGIPNHNPIMTASQKSIQSVLKRRRKRELMERKKLFQSKRLKDDDIHTNTIHNNNNTHTDDDTKTNRISDLNKHKMTQPSNDNESSSSFAKLLHDLYYNEQYTTTTSTCKTKNRNVTNDNDNTSLLPSLKVRLDYNSGIGTSTAKSLSTSSSLSKPKSTSANAVQNKGHHHQNHKQPSSSSFSKHKNVPFYNGSNVVRNNQLNNNTNIVDNHGSIVHNQKNCDNNNNNNNDDPFSSTIDFNDDVLAALDALDAAMEARTLSQNPQSCKNPKDHQQQQHQQQHQCGKKVHHVENSMDNSATLSRSPTLRTSNISHHVQTSQMSDVAPYNHKNNNCMQSSSSSSSTAAAATSNPILSNATNQPPVNMDSIDISDEYGDFPMIDFDELDKMVENRHLMMGNNNAVTISSVITPSNSSSSTSTTPTPCPSNIDNSPEFMNWTRYVICSIRDDVSNFVKTLCVKIWTREDGLLDDDSYEDNNTKYKQEKLQALLSLIDGTVALRGEWYHTRCEVGDVIHICSLSGRYKTDESALPINLNTTGVDDDLILIQHPDELITPTSISEAVSCSRRAVLKMRLGSSGLTGTFSSDFILMCIFHFVELY